MASANPLLSMAPAKIFQRFALAGLVLAAASCSSSAPEEPEPEPTPNVEEQQPMHLSAIPGDENFSRAKSPLENLYTDFGVYAWKEDASGTTQDVLRRSVQTGISTAAYSSILTRWTGNSWSYDITDGSVIQYLHYWDPAAANYTFSAYAPYSIGDTDLEDHYAINATPAGVSIQGVRGNASHSVACPDWLEARYRRVNAQPLADYDLLAADPTENISAAGATLTSVVPLVFHHILSQVEVRIYHSDPEANVVVASTNLTFTEGEVMTKADYSEGAWSSYAEAATVLFSHTGSLAVTGHDAESAVTLASVLELPQDLSAGVVGVSITLEDSANPLTGQFEIGEPWQGGKRYIYYLRITSAQDIILVDVTVEPFLSSEGSDIEGGTVVNW